MSPFRKVPKHVCNFEHDSSLIEVNSEHAFLCLFSKNIHGNRFYWQECGNSKFGVIMESEIELVYNLNRQEMGEETEAQRSKMTCSVSHSRSKIGLG